MTTINTEVLGQLKEVMEDDFVSLIDTFVSDTSQRLIVMEIAIGQEDSETLWSNAHSIKGSSGNLGAVGVELCCSKLETAARLLQSAQLQDLLDQLKAEFHKLVRQLDQYL